MKRLLLFLFLTTTAQAGDKWLCTAYCPCRICTNKDVGDPAYGITASGRPAQAGRTVAINWLPFGTEITIEGVGRRIVEDRGAKSLFGDKKNRIKHVDIFFQTHKEARQFGRQYLEVTIINP